MEVNHWYAITVKSDYFTKDIIKLIPSLNLLFIYLLTSDYLLFIY